MKILFIDDSESFRTLLHIWLEKTNYKYIIVASVAEAKHTLAKSTVDLIICDLLMPSESGIMLLEYIKETHSHIPVAIVSVLSANDYPTEKYVIKHRYMKPTDLSGVEEIIADLVEKENIKTNKDE